MLVYSDSDGNAIFTMDRPSAAFGSLGIAEVTKVGEDLDRKVVNLLRVVGVEAEQAFAQQREPGGAVGPHRIRPGCGSSAAYADYLVIAMRCA